MKFSANCIMECNGYNQSFFSVSETITGLNNKITVRLLLTVISKPIKILTYLEFEESGLFSLFISV